MSEASTDQPYQLSLPASLVVEQAEVVESAANQEEAIPQRSYYRPARRRTTQPVAVDGEEKRVEVLAEEEKYEEKDGYGDPASIIWSLYLTEAQKEDQALADNMNGDTNGVLVFTGLFAAVVASFIIDSYKLLQPDSAAATVTLLAQISQQIAAASNGSSLSASPPLLYPNSSPFVPPASAVRINIMWFLSLSLSLVCALTATLMQQWARRYLSRVQSAQRAGSPQKQGRIHAYLFQGLQSFRLASAVETLPALLHASVALFFAGMIEFLFTINTTVAEIVVAFFGSAVLGYAAVTILPWKWFNSPYATPLSHISPPFIRSSLLQFALYLETWLKDGVTYFEQRHLYPEAAIWAGIGRLYSPIASRVRRSIFRRNAFAKLADAAYTATGLDSSALNWTLLTIMDDDAAFMKFIAGLPGFLNLPRRGEAKESMSETLLDRTGFGSRLVQIISSTSSTPGPYESEQLTGLSRNRNIISCLACIRELCLSDSSYLYMPRPSESAVDQLLHSSITPIVELIKHEDPDICIQASITATHLARSLPYTRPYSDSDSDESSISRDGPDPRVQLLHALNDTSLDVLENPRVFNLYCVLGLVRRILPCLGAASRDCQRLAGETIAALLADPTLDEDWEARLTTELMRTGLFTELENQRQAIAAKMELHNLGSSGLENTGGVQTRVRDPYAELYRRLEPLFNWANRSMARQPSLFDAEERQFGWDAAHRRASAHGRGGNQAHPRVVWVTPTPVFSGPHVEWGSPSELPVFPSQREPVLAAVPYLFAPASADRSSEDGQSAEDDIESFRTDESAEQLSNRSSSPREQASAAVGIDTENIFFKAAVVAQERRKALQEQLGIGRSLLQSELPPIPEADERVHSLGDSAI